MKQTKLQRRKEAEQKSTSSVMMRPKNSKVNVFTNPERDVIYAWPYLHSEATAVLTHKYKALSEEGLIDHQETVDALLVIDRITKFYIQFHKDAITCRSGAFGNVRELYVSLTTELEKAIFAEYTAAVTNAVPCLLFASQTFAMGADESTPQETLDMNALHNLLGSLSPKLRKKVAQELLDEGHISNKADIRHLLKQTESYIPGIMEEEERQRKKCMENPPK